MPGAMRIPRIKFPRRHPKPSSTGSESQAAESSAASSRKLSTANSDVPRSPSNLAVGGKAALQPKRTPVTKDEIESILLGGCI